jgi:hypothetical protein
LGLKVSLTINAAKDCMKFNRAGKSQIPIFNDLNRFGILNLGYCDLFEICVLLFGISKDP